MGLTTKQYLSQIERLDRMIQNKLSEIYQLKTMTCSVTVANDKEKVQSSSDQDRLGNTVAKIVDLEKETDSLVDKLVDKRKQIIAQIDGMDNVTYYHILFNKYVAKKNLVQIAEEIPCSYRQITRYHGEALLEFERKYGKDYI